MYSFKSVLRAKKSTGLAEYSQTRATLIQMRHFGMPYLAAPRFAFVAEYTMGLLL